ncbi:MAG: putative lipoprotein [Arcticibacterium sp.]|jgi:predicted lipoprotein
MGFYINNSKYSKLNVWVNNFVQIVKFYLFEWKFKMPLIVILSAISALACKELKEPVPVNEADKEEAKEIAPVDRGDVFTNIFDDIILKQYEVFNDKAKSFLEDVDEFKEEPTLSSLESLQEQWKEYKLVWEGIEIYDIGYIADNFLHNRIDKYPTNVKFIEKNLSEGKTLDNNFVDNSGSTTVGLPVLEYLLFKGESQNEILAHFTSDTNNHHYLDYVSSLSGNLAEKSEEILTELKKERNTWILNEGENTLNELINSQISILEEIRGTKLDKPLGSANGGNPDPEIVESPYANASFDAIRFNLYSLKLNMEADTSKSNLYDLLNYIQRDEDNKLVNKIQDALEASLVTLGAFSNPLKVEVVNNTTGVEKLSEEIGVLLVAIKVDLANLLGVTVVFNDNDGD